VETGFQNFYPDASSLAELLMQVKDGKLSLNMAKEVFDEMKSSRKKASAIIAEKGLEQVNDEAKLLDCIRSIMQDSPQQLEQFRAGKDKLFGFFMGQCQKRLQGKGNPVLLKELLERELKK
jgi:aspartyl-tRNA(Asn)/glutamyl-tRNA(Gln) amidotransferase subunit B